MAGTNRRRTAVQIGGVLQYKLEVYIAAFPCLQSLVRVAHLQNEIAPNKKWIRYEEGFEKHEKKMRKKIRKFIRKVSEKFLAPLRSLTNISPALL